MATGTTADLGERQIRGMFFEALNGSRSLEWVNKIANQFTSDQAIETYKWLSQSPVLREWVSGRRAKAFTTNGITIENLEFEATIGIKDKDMRRDKTGQIKMRMRDLVKRSRTHWASLLSTLIMNGETLLGYDGKAFFATDHSEGQSGTFSNLLTSSDYSEFNVATATNPTANEMADVIMKGIQHLYSFKDDQGEPRNEDNVEFLVMVPNNMWGATSTAAKKNMLTAAAGSRDNPLVDQDFKVSVVSNSRLTWTDKLAIFVADSEAKPFIAQSETDINPEILGPGSDHFFKEKEWLIGIDCNRNVGLGLHSKGVKITLS